MDNTTKPSMATWGLLALAVAAVLYVLWGWSGDDRLERALSSYQKGEGAATVAEREQAFNDALTLYRQLAESYPDETGSGALQYNIANSYFQLGEYPWAILYYYKALKLDPGNGKARHNLQIALEKIGQREPVATAPWLQFVTLSSFWSVGQRFQIFFALSLVAIGSGAAFIMRGVVWLRGVAYLAGSLAAMMLVSIALSWYGSYPQAVVLRATMLYRDAGKQYAKVREEPVAPGSRVDILDTAAEGQWVMVDVGGSVIGYIPVDRIGII